MGIKTLISEEVGSLLLSHWKCYLVGQVSIPCPRPGEILESFLNMQSTLILTSVGRVPSWNPDIKIGTGPGIEESTSLI